MARTRDEKRYARKKREIAEAASRVFVRRGFHSAGMQEICREAKMSPGGLYRYFDSKDDIIVAIAEQENADLDELFEFASSIKDPVEAIMASVKLILKETTKPDYVRLALEILSESFRNPPVQLAAQRTERRLLEGFLSILNGHFPNRAKENAQIAVFVTVFIDGMSSRSATEKTIKPRHQIQLLRRFLEASLGG